jgi:hypothetical protein
MSVIYSFATTEELNTYYAESLNNSSIIPVNTGCLYYVYKHISEDSIALEAIKQYSKGHINTLDFERIINMQISLQDNPVDYASEMHNLTTNKYIFVGSKTVFRNTIHPNIIESLYKNFYTTLKDLFIVEKATGNFVVLNDANIPEDNLNKINVASGSETSIYSIGNYLSSLEEDKKYLLNYIDRLQQNISAIQGYNESLIETLNNKSLTTWY